MDHIILSVVLFCVGVFGILIRRNLIAILVSIEVMLAASNLAFVAFSRMNGSLDGQAVVLINFVVAACEAAVGLAIIVSLFRLRGNIDIEKWRELRH